MPDKSLVIDIELGSHDYEGGPSKLTSSSLPKLPLS